MKFGVFDHLDRYGAALDAFYDRRLDLIDLYERAGFYSYHVAEHHGTPLGMAPSPNLFLTAVARRTARLRFGPLVYLLPLYHPIRLAEEIGMLDQLGKGRLDVGVGRGRSPIELESFGTDPDQAEAMFDEAFAILRTALRDGRVSFRGEHYTFSDVPVQTRPLQTPHPPFWYGIGSVASVDRCVARGFNAVTMAKPATATEIARRYRAEAVRSHQPELFVGICRFVVVAPTDAAALAIARRAYPVWHASFDYLYALHGARPVQSWPADFDTMQAAGLAFAGSPATIVRTLGAQLEDVGANYCVGQFVFGDMSHAECTQSIELFGTEVIPAITGALAPA